MKPFIGQRWPKHVVLSFSNKTSIRYTLSRYWFNYPTN